MAVVLGSNISSLGAQRQLLKSSNALDTVFERLSSGQRINRASDDAAGLAISESLNADTRVLSQAVRNINDGISQLTIAESAVAEAKSILERLQELSIQAANGSYSDSQRNALDVEAQALSEEYSRILSSTEFNGENIFTKSGGTALQIGLGSSDSLEIDFRETEEIVSGLGTYSTQNISNMNGYATVFDATAVVADFNGDGIDDITFAQFTSSGTFDARFNGTIVLGTESGTYSNFDNYLSITTVSGSSGQIYISLIDNGSDGDTDFILQVDGPVDDYYTTVVNDGTGNVTPIAGSSGTLITAGDDVGGTTVYGDFNGDGVDDFATITSSGATLRLQISTQDTETSTGYGFLELDSFSIATSSGALSATTVFEQAQTTLDTMQGKIGASLSRLETALRLNQDTVTEFESARSRIVDADVAQEVANLTRQSILQQAATAVLGQANIQPEIAIKLLDPGG